MGHPKVLGGVYWGIKPGLELVKGGLEADFSGCRGVLRFTPIKE